MFAHEEYLFPYVWAERQFRDDNYQMGSQALLEDMFFDTFGDFLRRTEPSLTFTRRTGKEPWDYRLNEDGFSHKEAITPGFTAVWQAGEGPGNKTPRYPSWDFPHSVVFVYTPLSVKVQFTTEVALASGSSTPVTGSVTTLSHALPSRKDFADGIVFLAEQTGGSLSVVRTWSATAWRSLSVHEVRSAVGTDRLLSSNFWYFRPSKAQTRQGLRLAEWRRPLITTHTQGNPLPGLYVFEKDQLQGVPLASNNKAHFPSKATVLDLMDDAVRAGRYVPLPMWPGIFADTTPPNLYQIQKERFDDLFRARRR
jgi:hypothetical protein